MNALIGKKARRYRESVARQRGSKHAFITMGHGVFRGIGAKENLKNKRH
jgi:hypothetical protein